MGRTSSAVPADLHRYSRVGLDMDSALWHQASGLERVAERFESTCSEYRVPIRQHVDGMRRLYGWSFDLDFYAKRVAEGFERADQATALGMRSPQSVAVADGPLAEHARLLLLRLNLSRGTADYRQPITLIRRLRFMLWWRALRPWSRAPIAFASVLFSGAMWPVQMVAWTGAGTWAEPLWPPRAVQGLWYVASVVGNAAKRLLATIWAGGRTPEIPSPVEPVETGFGRIIRKTEAEAGVTELPASKQQKERSVMRQDQLGTRETESVADELILGLERVEECIGDDKKFENTWFGPIRTIQDHIKAFGCLLTCYTMLLRDLGHDVKVTDLYKANYNLKNEKPDPADPRSAFDQDAEDGSITLANLYEEPGVVASVAPGCRVSSATLAGADPGQVSEALRVKLQDGQPVIVNVATGTSDGHWVIVDGVNADGTFTVRDPMEGEVSSATFGGSGSGSKYAIRGTAGKYVLHTCVVVANPKSTS